MKMFNAVKILFDKITAFWNLVIFTLLSNKGFVSAQILHAQGNQLVTKLLLKPSDTLRTQFN